MIARRRSSLSAKTRSTFDSLMSVLPMTLAPSAELTTSALNHYRRTATANRSSDTNRVGPLSLAQGNGCDFLFSPWEVLIVYGGFGSASLISRTSPEHQKSRGASDT